MASLIEMFMGQVTEMAVTGYPPAPGVQAAMEQYGWSTRDIAEQFGVSPRTARRWRQQDRVPARRAEVWQVQTLAAAVAATEQQIAQTGITYMAATGQYRVSENHYLTGPGAPVRTLVGTISGDQMSQVFETVNADDIDGADALLNEALAEAYGAPGLVMEDVETLEWNI